MKRRISILLCTLLLAAALFSGCSAQTNNEFSGDSQEVAETGAPGAAFDREYGLAEEAADTAGSTVLQDNRKLITTTSLSIETADFQGYIDALESAVTQHHGYVETSDLSGTGSHWASYTVRIPSDEVNAFLESLEGKGVVSGKSTSVEDVTLTYTDTESHLKALRTQEESLLRLMEQAGSVEDLMSVESRLSDVRYEIESYESQLRLYDNLIEYTTVNFTIEEVLREQPVMEEKAGTWAQIGHNLKENFYSVGEFLRSAFVAIVSILPFLLLVGLVIFVILFFALILPRRRRKKKNSSEAAE